jgi:hypothetical protein
MLHAALHWLWLCGCPAPRCFLEAPEVAVRVAPLRQVSGSQQDAEYKTSGKRGCQARAPAHLTLCLSAVRLLNYRYFAGDVIVCACAAYYLLLPGRRRAGAPTSSCTGLAVFLHVVSGVSLNLQWVFSSACMCQLHMLVRERSQGGRVS